MDLAMGGGAILAKAAFVTPRGEKAACDWEV